MTIVLNGSVGIPASSLSGVIPDANAPSGSVVQVVSVADNTLLNSTSTTLTDTSVVATITPGVGGAAGKPAYIPPNVEIPAVGLTESGSPA